MARAEQQNISTEQLRAEDEAQRIEGQYPNAHTSELDPVDLSLAQKMEAEAAARHGDYGEDLQTVFNSDDISMDDRTAVYEQWSADNIDQAQGESISNDISVDGGEQGQEL